jgi:LysR family transcriptional regulator for metE and metH
LIEAIVELMHSGYGISILQRDLVTPSLERGEKQAGKSENS